MKSAIQKIFRKFRHWAERWEGQLWIGAVAAVIGVGAFLSWWFWEDLQSPRDSLSTTIRNVALVVGGLIAVLLAIWRGRVAERQVETAQQSLLNDRHQRAVEMLGSSVLTVRLGGIYALRGVVAQHPEQYHVPVMEQLCSFVRHPIEVEGQPTVSSSEINFGQIYGASTAQEFAESGSFEIEVVREDIKAAMNSIGSCHTRNLRIETLNNYWIDLHGADLRGVDLIANDLSGAPPGDIKGEPSFSYPDHATIGWWYTNLKGVNLRHANLHHANLTSVDLSFTSGLTQSALDGAYADPKMPPRLNFAFDADTGKQLVWQMAPGNIPE